MHAPTQAYDAVFIRVSVGRCYISFFPPVAMAKYSYKSSLKKGRFVLLTAEGTVSSSCQGSHGCRGWKQPVPLHGQSGAASKGCSAS